MLNLWNVYNFNRESETFNLKLPWRIYQNFLYITYGLSIASEIRYGRWTLTVYHMHINIFTYWNSFIQAYTLSKCQFTRTTLFTRFFISQSLRMYLSSFCPFNSHKQLSNLYVKSHHLMLPIDMFERKKQKSKLKGNSSYRILM